ncbi:MAG: glycine cleavage system protein GcvH [Elusimicrobia bacterium]|nr:glycine cleavage system protein GcvH [Elusimicrobiota bacterium]
MDDLNQIKFAKTHEWIAPDGTVGISDHAQKEITDVVFIELPQTGKTVSQESEAGTIESVKAAFPIYAPVSGQVVAVNQDLSQDPSLVNQSPYGKGWIFKLKIADSNELNSLMTHSQYQEFLKSSEPVH